MEPSTTVQLEGDDAETMLALADALDDLDDVQDVYANFDISDEEMARLAVACRERASPRAPRRRRSSTRSSAWERRCGILGIDPGSIVTGLRRGRARRRRGSATSRTARSRPPRGAPLALRLAALCTRRSAR